MDGGAALPKSCVTWGLDEMGEGEATAWGRLVNETAADDDDRDDGADVGEASCRADDDARRTFAGASFMIGGGRALCGEDCVTSLFVASVGATRSTDDNAGDTALLGFATAGAGSPPLLSTPAPALVRVVAAVAGGGGGEAAAGAGTPRAFPPASLRCGIASCPHPGSASALGGAAGAFIGGTNTGTSARSK